MSSTTSKLLRGVLLGAVVFSVLLSLYIGFIAQASSPNYEKLFISLSPFVAVDAALVVFVCLSKEKAKIWIVTVPAVLAFASYFEMAFRVWFGFRLI